MTHVATGSPVPRITRGLTLVAALLGGSSALAQVAEDVEPDSAPKLVVRPRVVAKNRMIDRLISSISSSAGRTRTQSESLLRLQIEDVDRAYSLTDAQKKKLHLAGQGELKRFFDELDIKILEIKAAKNDGSRVVDVDKEMEPLLVKLGNGFFGTDSPYQRAVKHILNPEQYSKFERDFQDRHVYAFQARLEVVVGIIDKTIGFYDDQRERFFKIVRDEIPVPNVTNDMASSYILYCIAQLPDAKIMPIFDQRQWGVLSLLPQQMHGRRRDLESYGYKLPEPKVAPKRLNPIPQNTEAGTQ